MFEAQCGVGPNEWHCRWNDENQAVELEPVIPGRRGQVYPFGPGQLGVYVTGPNGASARRVLRSHPEWDVLVEGDTEIVLIAPTEDLDAAACAVKAYRRVSKAAREARAARMKVLRRNDREVLDARIDVLAAAHSRHRMSS